MIRNVRHHSLCMELIKQWHLLHDVTGIQSRHTSRLVMLHSSLLTLPAMLPVSPDYTTRIFK